MSSKHSPATPHTRDSKSRCFSRLGLSTAIMLAYATAASAQVIDVDVPAQPLGNALQQLGSQTNLQILYSPDAIRNLKSKAVKGSIESTQALDKLIEGTGITYRIEGNTITLAAPGHPTSTGLELSETQVTAQAPGNITENSDSYTLGTASIGGKTQQALRETPQTVSVITAQRMKDQHLTDLAQTLNQTSGITLVGGNDANTRILSRGFSLSNIQTDGGAPAMREESYETLPDMTPYDHVEVLRGSDGLYGGIGEPAGSINLVRKRALDYNQLKIETSAGSWDNYRTMVDATGPLGFDGKLRGRVAASYEDKKYFYERADSEKHVFYGVLEADVTPDTLVTAGGIYEWRDMDGYWDEGLPRYISGEPLGLSRRTSLAADWSTNNYKKTESFFKLQHQINDNWKFDTSYTKTKFDTVQNQGQVEGPIDPTMAKGGTYQRFIRNYTNNQDLLDLNFQGKFNAFGRQHELLFGADYTQSRRTYSDHSDFSSAIAVDPINDNVGSFPEPARPPLYYDTPSWVVRKTGLYSTLKAQLADPLKLIVGARYTDYNGFNRVVAPSFNADTTKGGKESGIITPYGGLVYDLTNQWSLYTSYAQIYKPQTAYMDASFAPLKAITGNTYEFGTKGELFNGRLNVSSALYYVKRENEAVSVGNAAIPGSGNNCCYVAAGEIVSKGIDSEISGELLPGWQLSAGYTFNLNEQSKATDGQSNGKPISTQTPKHLFKFFTTYQLPGELERWKVGVGATLQSANYVSGTVQRRLGDGSLSPSVDPFSYTQAGYAVWNSLLEYRIDDHWTAALNGNNLFDKTYYQTVSTSSYGNWYGEPRNFMLSLRGTF
ncbi:TonB-dependent siderophore receptor [Pseudomonas agarici]|nr:TonB-dependent receptor [Pseudomonas agarici]